MPLHTTPEPLPRRVYFGAVDKQHLAKRPLSGGPSQHEIEVGRRSKIAADVAARAEDVAQAIKSLRAFDTTGSTQDALDHLQATVQDLNRAHGILVDHVTEAIGRYRDRRENETILAESTTGRQTVEYVKIPTVEISGQFTDAAAAQVAAGHVPGMSIAAVLAEKTPKPGPRA